MKYIALVILMFSLPCFAVEYNVGLAGAVGLGISRWEGEFYNFEGVYVTDHLDSKELVYHAGLDLSVWITEAFGIETGVQYGMYNYNYSYESTTDTVESEWNYDNLLIPIHLMYGIPVAGNRLVIGAGVYICKELSGSAPGFDIPDTLLMTNVGPAALLGYEIHTGNLCIFPSFRYVNGINGLSDQFASSPNISYKHYFMLGVGLLYNL
ncbi:MAG: outer membrane beta-barrel protein [candidate division WOR-3 bacterium]|nr:MAG: outer membrane beta-barrel protein [candidate division WOR-3 bacterium]